MVASLCCIVCASSFIKKLDTNSFLSSLTTNRGPITPAFSKTSQDYSLLVSSSTTTIQITAVATSSLASGGYAIFPVPLPSTVQQTPTTTQLKAGSYIALPAGGVTPDIQLSVGYNYVGFAIQAEDPTTPGGTSVQI
jgi:hypothetical protein